MSLAALRVCLDLLSRARVTRGGTEKPNDLATACDGRGSGAFVNERIVRGTPVLNKQGGLVAKIPKGFDTGL